jgi:hypothetical protein
MLAPLTISYSDDVQGWTSFWSFIPDYMIYLSNNFYTFKNGNLFLHNDPSATRTVYYPNTPFSNSPFCSVRTVFNDDPLEVKLFKTLSLESTSAWDAYIFTDLISGNIDESWFQLKEGGFFAHIRRNPNLPGATLISTSQLDDSLSTRIVGVGSVLSTGAGYIEFSSFPSQSFKITNIAFPDQLYAYTNAGALTYVGDVSIVDNSSANPKIFVTGAGAVVPNVGDTILAVKNSTAESYGARGYYMDTTLVYNSGAPVELFYTGATVFKSFM